MEPQVKGKYLGIIMSDGKNSDLYPLNKNFPSACLPVGNKKLIVYALEQLSGVHDLCSIVVLCEKSNAQLITGAKNQFLGSHPDFNYPIQCLEVANNQQDHVSLQQFLGSKEFSKYKQVAGAIIMPIDTISSASVASLLEFHKSLKSDLTLLLKIKKEDSQNDKKPDAEFEPEQEVDIGLIDRGGQVISLDCMSDYQYRGVRLSKSVYREVSMATFYKVIDSRIYVLSPNSLKIARNLVSSEVTNIKGDFVTTLINHKNNTRLLNYISELHATPLRVSASVLQPNEYLRRVSSTKVYENLNLESLTRGPKQRQTLLPNKYTEPIDKDLTTLYKGNLFGSGCEVGHGCKIRRTCVGRNCKIAENVEILNTVILNNVTIEEGVKISDCLIGPNCRVGRGAQLNSCQLARNSEIGNNCRNEGEVVLPIN